MQPKNPRLKRRSITRKIQLPEGLMLMREVNMILFPFFVMGKMWNSKTDETDVMASSYHDGRPGNVRYEIRVGKVSRAIEIQAASKYGVPLEFDYHVFLAILALQAKSGKQTKFEVTVADIINVLGITKGGRTYKDIHDSIQRLSTTNWKIDQIFTRKAKQSEVVSQDPSEQDDLKESENFGNFMNDVSEPSVTVESSSTENGRMVRDEQFWNVNLFRLEMGSVQSDADSGNIRKARYRIELGDFIKKSISDNYFRYIDADKLFSLPSASLKRFYEIIEFQRNGRRTETFEYEKLAGMIPLHSGRMNKSYIVKYANSLKEIGYIVGFDTEKDRKKIEIEFPTRQKEFGSGSGQEGEGDQGQENKLKIAIREMLNRKGVSSPTVEEVYNLMTLEGANPKRLDADGLISNLEYTFRVRKSRSEGKGSFLGYLRGAIQGDYAGNSAPAGKKREKKEADSGHVRTPEKTEQQKAAEMKRKSEVFNAYVSGLSREELQGLYERHKVFVSKDERAMKTLLMTKLFSSGELVLGD